MLSVVQSLVPPVGAYNLGKHRSTVKINQEESTNYQCHRVVIFELTIYMKKRMQLFRLFLRDIKTPTD